MNFDKPWQHCQQLVNKQVAKLFDSIVAKAGNVIQLPVATRDSGFASK